MKMNLLIATEDRDYSEHLSKTLSKYFSDLVVVSVCSSTTRLAEMLKEQRYDTALFEGSFCEDINNHDVSAPFVLWTEGRENQTPETFVKIRKYQRVSTIFGEILENYAKVPAIAKGVNLNKANITAVWSPSGGVGKTTVALALAAFEASKDKKVMYLNLELFSSVPTYFDTNGKSISAIFEMLETSSGNVNILIQSMLRQDSSNNISYLCCPDNFDDMNILSVENISALITACSELTDELIIDMSCLCDERARHTFEVADRILLVSDGTNTAQVKLEHFMNRHNIFSQIKDKIYPVANKGAKLVEVFPNELISLPFIESGDERRIYKVLSSTL